MLIEKTEVLVKPQKIYTGTAARILKLLSSGTVNQEQAAKAVGVDPSYVSQLCAEEDFQLQVAEAIKKGIEQAIAIDETYGNIEKSLSKKLSELVPWMTTPEQVLRTLKFVNEAKRKTQVGTPTRPNGSNGSDGNGVVKLLMPIIAKQVFITNPQNEVVAVDGRELVTLNSTSMTEFVKAKKATPKLTVQKDSNDSSQDKWGSL